MPEAPIAGGVIKVTIDGTPMEVDDAATILRCTVEQQLNLPAACTVLLSPRDHDPSSNLVADFGEYALGTPISVAIGLDEFTEIFSGKIAAVEPDFDPSCRHVEITGYDALFDLDFGATARVFQDSTDGEIAEQLIEDAGLEPAVDATEAIYPYVLQNNVSAFRLLRARAKRIGYELVASGRRVAFRASRAGEDPVASLEFGVTLSRVRARARAIKRGGSVTRVGWDPKSKQVITATVEAGSPSDDMGGEEDGYEASALFPSSAVIRPDAGIADTEIARALAGADYEDGLAGFVEGDAECGGNPLVVAGVNVELSGVGARFSGLYYVVAACHTFDLSDGYRTRFEVRRSGI